jgi:hypothetical protein
MGNVETPGRYDIKNHRLIYQWVINISVSTDIVPFRCLNEGMLRP